MDPQVEKVICIKCNLEVSKDELRAKRNECRSCYNLYQRDKYQKRNNLKKSLTPSKSRHQKSEMQNPKEVEVQEDSSQNDIENIFSEVVLNLRDQGLDNDSSKFAGQNYEVSHAPFLRRMFELIREVKETNENLLREKGEAERHLRKVKDEIIFLRKEQDDSRQEIEKLKKRNDFLFDEYKIIEATLSELCNEIKNLPKH